MQFRSLSDGIDTSTATGELVFHLMGALAEFEANLIRERTMAGLSAARSRGRVGGRPPTVTADQAAAAVLLHAGGKSWDQTAEVLQVSRSALFRALQRSSGTTELSPAPTAAPGTDLV